MESLKISKIKEGGCNGNWKLWIIFTIISSLLLLVVILIVLLIIKRN